jgi:hypothetical protein
MRISKQIRSALLGLALTAGLASGASATQLTITDVETGNGALGNVTIGDYGNPWTTPILMTDNQGQTYVVFCDDFFRDVYVGGGQNLSYHTGEVTGDGTGHTFSESVSNVLGQLAVIGRNDYLQHNENGAIAAQAMIWEKAYGQTASSTDEGIQSFITQYRAIQDNGHGYAYGFISDVGTQNQVVGFNPAPAPLAAGLPLAMAAAAMVARKAQRRRQVAV